MTCVGVQLTAQLKMMEDLPQARVVDKVLVLGGKAVIEFKWLAVASRKDEQQ